MVEPYLRLQKSSTFIEDNDIFKIICSLTLGELRSGHALLGYLKHLIDLRKWYFSANAYRGPLTTNYVVRPG